MNNTNRNAGRSAINYSKDLGNTQKNRILNGQNKYLTQNKSVTNFGYFTNERVFLLLEVA